MRSVGSGPGVVLLVLLVVSGGGCNSQDADRLARVAGAAAARVEALTAGADGRLTGWPSFPANLDELSLDARISAWLRWDKGLAGLQIEVHTVDGVVELKGSVHDLEQRRRAVELAQSTAGTDKVTDSLEVPGQEP